MPAASTNPHPRETREKNLADFILSISGWRKIFAGDHEGESLATDLSAVDREMLSCAARVIGAWFRERGQTRIALGRDSRPTGAAMESLFLRGLLSSGVEVALLGVCAIPQFLAYVQRGEEIGGFVYLSASHNPPGHNGLKLGLGDGTILAAEPAEELRRRFVEHYLSDAQLFAHLIAIEKIGEDDLNAARRGQPENALLAARRYFGLTYEVAAGTGEKARQADFLKNLEQCLRRAAPLVACDFNGSARIHAIDREALSQFGVATLSMNDAPGVYAHRIVPEGESLEPLKRVIQEAIERDGAAAPILGWVPDCDGDRGNLVLTIDPGDGRERAMVPDAQSTFFLAVLSELSFLELFDPGDRGKIAVVANDPTSLRCDGLCRAFGASLLRAEVGEANVIALARRKQAEGWRVRILGEGSNGGNITFPGTVRDPLTTVLSVLKLLYLKTAEGLSLWEHALSRLGLPPLAPGASAPRRLGALLSRCEAFTTTGAFDADALVRLETRDHALLKKEYEALFSRSWFDRAPALAVARGIRSYRILNYEGIQTLPGPANRTGREDGGWKAEFLDEHGQPLAFIWMRGSRTEAIFRVMADVQGDKGFEQELLAWHREILSQADRKAMQGV